VVRGQVLGVGKRQRQDALEAMGAGDRLIDKSPSWLYLHPCGEDSKMLYVECQNISARLVCRDAKANNGDWLKRSDVQTCPHLAVL